MADQDASVTPEGVPGRDELAVIAEEHDVEVNWNSVPIPARVLIGVLAAKLAAEKEKTKSLTAEAASLVNQVLEARAALDDAQRRVSEIESRVGLAFSDHLTSLPNSRAFRRDMERLLANFPESGRRRTDEVGRADVVFFYDLDDFKPINERAGYFIGDMMLITAAKRMSDEQRPGDVTYRWAQGDEFARLARNLDPSEYDILGASIKSSVLAARDEVLAIIDDDEAFRVLYERANEELRSLGVTEGRRVMREVVSKIGVTVGVMPITEHMTVDEITRRAFSFMQKLKHDKKNSQQSSDTPS